MGFLEEAESEERKRGQSPLVVSDIPLRTNASDDIMLGMRCSHLFNHRRNREVVVITEEGVILWGFTKLRHVLSEYRTRKKLGSIRSLHSAVVNDLVGNRW